MHNDHTVVDDLIAEIADSKSSYQVVAVETLKRLCLESCEAYGHLQERMLDSQIPDCSQRLLGDVLATVRTQWHACEDLKRICETTSYHDDSALNYVLRHYCVPKIC